MGQEPDVRANDRKQHQIACWNSKPEPPEDTYLRFDCRVNALSIGVLFQLYERGGLLYSEKMHKLAPFLPIATVSGIDVQRSFRTSVVWSIPPSGLTAVL